MKEKLTPQYNDAVKQIKTAILQSQAKGVATYQAGQKKLMELLPDEEEMKKIMTTE